MHDQGVIFSQRGAVQAEKSIFVGNCSATGFLEIDIRVCQRLVAMFFQHKTGASS